MLGTLLSLGLGAYAAGSALSGIGQATENKRNAIKEGKPYYYDQNNKQRSVKTDEIVITNYVDSTHGGHTVLVGCTTHTVYHDYTLEKLDEANKKLKEEGKKYIYKEYPNVHFTGRKYSSWQPTFWPYDPVVKLPYSIESFRPYEYKEHLDKPIKKVYYVEPDPSKHCLDMYKVDHIEYLSLEEAKPWMHGTKRRTFN